jgi:ABC-type branched-subunit amino acid transport system ATPase component
MNQNNEILKLKNLTKRFDGVIAVDNLNIGFYENQITALIGPNGAGKTTIFNLINGLYQPTEGEIYFKEKLLNNLKPHQIAKLGIARLYQDVRVFQKLTALENILVSFPDELGENFLDGIFKRKKVKEREKEQIEKAREYLDFVGLSGYEDYLAGDLSYGQQKLLAIARLMASNTELFLLDEPASGIHPKLIAKISQLILSLKEMGKTIIFIEHNINVVLDIADWVFLLDEGRVVAFGLPDEILYDDLTRKVYLGV